MASTYSPSLRIELIGSGEQSGTWGTTTNSNLGTLIDQAIAGVAPITLFDADYTLTAYNGASDQARQAVLVISGTLTASRSIIAPLVSKSYVIKNNTSGGFAITIGATSGTSATIPSATSSLVYCDGTNFSTAFTNSATANSLAGGVASQLVYQTGVSTTGFIANGTAGQFLTSNGTNVPTWATPGVSNITTNIANGAASQIPYQTNTNVTAFIPNGAAGQVLTSNGAAAPYWNTAGVSTSAVNLSGGVAGALPYQSAVNTTAFLAVGVAGRSLLCGGAGAPTWGIPAVPYTSLTGTVPTWNQSTTGSAASAGAVPYSGLTGVVPTWNQNTTGSAAHAPYSGLTGTVPTWNQSTTGNAATVTNGVYTGADNSLSGQNYFSYVPNLSTGRAGISLGAIVYDNTGHVPALITSISSASITVSAAVFGQLSTTNTAPAVNIAVNNTTAPLVTFTKGVSAAFTAIGSITNTGSGVAYNTTSDYRLKENIVPINGASERLLALKPCRFDWIASSLHQTVDGFIAHEVEQVVPEAITGAKDAVDEHGLPKYQGIDQSKLVPLLVASLQDALVRISVLETKLAAQ